MDLNKENLTTIGVFIYMLVSPVLATYGVEIEQTQFISVIVGVFGLILAIKSAKHPNTLSILGNSSNEDETTPKNTRISDESC